MKPEKVFEKVICISCGATAPNDSKHRGRFRRRHDRDNVCGNWARRQEALRTAQEINAKAKGITLGGDDGTRVNMSGNAGVAGEVATEVLPGGAQ